MNEEAPERPRTSGARQGGARRRSHYEQERGDGHWLRLAALVGAIGLAAAVLLFWRGRDAGIPAGVGERLTVVTADSGGASAARPRSGSVEIGQHETPLVPEVSQNRAEGAAPGDRGGDSSPVSRREEPSVATAGQRPGGNAAPIGSARAARQERGREATRDGVPAREPAGAAPAYGSVPEPGASGRWAVQIGAFGSEENAQALMQQLRQAGFSPQLRADSAASGAIIHRVWIGYFGSREDAQRYARAHERDLGEGFPVQR
jgi:cell division septation protein DedD